MFEIREINEIKEIEEIKDDQQGSSKVDEIIASGMLLEKLNNRLGKDYLIKKYYTNNNNLDIETHSSSFLCH